MIADMDRKRMSRGRLTIPIDRARGGLEDGDAADRVRSG